MSDLTFARWTFACSRCEWTGNDPAPGLWFSMDCPECGESCSTDEPLFEPAPGLRDGLPIDPPIPEPWRCDGCGKHQSGRFRARGFPDVLCLPCAELEAAR